MGTYGHSGLRRNATETYSLERLGELLLSWVDAKLVALLLVHVDLELVVLLFPVFDPVTDTGLMVVFGAARQLLRSEVHLDFKSFL
jgi:hypothetical protein